LANLPILTDPGLKKGGKKNEIKSTFLLLVLLFIINILPFAYSFN